MFVHLVFSLSLFYFYFLSSISQLNDSLKIGRKEGRNEAKKGKGTLLHTFLRFNFIILNFVYMCGGRHMPPWIPPEARDTGSYELSSILAGN